MNMIKKVILVAGILLGSNVVLADVDCSTVTCEPLEGTVYQLGLDHGNLLHTLLPAFPATTASTPHIFVKILLSTGVYEGENCGLGTDSGYGYLPYNSSVRQEIYTTLLTAQSTMQTISVVIEPTTCEIAAVAFL